jgi:ParB-like chromosome segregation protein Spo0J
VSSLQLEHWPPERLVGYARNPRRNDAVVERMAEAIAEFGFRIPIVAKSDGSVVDGHLRLKAAQALGLASVPVVLADDLSEAQIKAFRLLANRSATWAEWDNDLLALELADLMAADLAPGHLVGADAEMLVAEVPEAGQQLVDLGLFGHEGGEGLLAIGLGPGLAALAAVHRPHSAAR